MMLIIKIQEVRLREAKSLPHTGQSPEKGELPLWADMPLNCAGNMCAHTPFFLVLFVYYFMSSSSSRPLDPQFTWEIK